MIPGKTQAANRPCDRKREKLMAAAQKIIRKSARELGISYNTKNTAAHGTYRNYTVLLYLGDSASKPEILVSVCAGSVGAPLNPQEVAARIPEAAGCNCAADKYRIYLSFPIKGKQSDLTDRIVDTVRILIDYFERNAWDNCDETGNTGPTSVYKVRGRLTFLTDFTAQYVQKTVAQDADRNAQKQEKYLPGLLGALLGSLIGAVIVFIVARLGFISTISSAALGFAIVLGYRKLAGKISLPSAVLCVLLSAAVTYLVFRLDAAISIYKTVPMLEYIGSIGDGSAGLYQAFSGSSPRLGLWDCFAHTRALYTLADAADVYFRNQLLMMLADMVTAVAVVAVEYSGQKEQFTVYRL